MTRGKTAGIFLVAMVFSNPVPLHATHGDPMYYYYFYSDSTYSVDVGIDTPGCSNYGTVYTLSGQRTQYVLSELIGYCANDGYQPILEPVGAG